MIWFQIYMLFAVTTGITAVLELLMPVVAEYEKDHVISQKYVTYFTFFIVSVLMAPAVLLSCLVPSMGDRFRKVLVTSLFQE